MNLKTKLSLKELALVSVGAGVSSAVTSTIRNASGTMLDGVGDEILEVILGFAGDRLIKNSTISLLADGVMIAGISKLATQAINQFYPVTGSVGQLRTGQTGNNQSPLNSVGVPGR
jgi:hypothetical protein